MRNPNQWQYQAKAEPVSTEPEAVRVDKWFVQSSEPLPLVAAVALAATVIIVEPVLAVEVPFDWYQQQPDLIREVEPAQEEHFTYESYCFTSQASFKNFTFLNQTQRFIARWEATPSAQGKDGVILIADNAGSVFDDYACRVRFATNDEIELLINPVGPVFGSDVTFTYTAGVKYSFRLHVDLEHQVNTLFVDGILVASQFPLAGTGPSAPETNLDHWAIRGVLEAFEICDFRVENDLSDLEIVPTYTSALPPPAPEPAEAQSLAFVPLIEEEVPFDWLQQHLEPQAIPKLPEGQSVVDPDLLTQPEAVRVDKWFVQSADIEPAPDITPADPPFVPVVERVPGPDEYQFKLADPGPRLDVLEGIVVIDADQLTKPEAVRVDKWFVQAPDLLEAPEIQPEAIPFVRVVERVPGPDEYQTQPAELPERPELAEGIFVVDPFLLTQAETVLLDKWFQQQPDPIEIDPVLPVEVQFIFVEPVPAPPLDSWFQQHPGPFPPPPVALGWYTVDPDLLTQAETVLLDKWFQQYPGPLPVQFSLIGPTVAEPPLGAVPVVGTTEETLNTFLTGYVGIPGTKYRFRIRQIEGSAELQTVASRSVVRAKFYPRSRLLAANAMVQVIDNPGHDASLERQAASVPRIFDFLRTRESGSTGSANAHICFEFDVSAFAGILYRSVKLRLTNEDSLRENVLFNSSFRLTRIIRPWALSTEDVTWNQYDRNLVAPLGNWSTGGGRGIDDRAESVTWAPSFPFPFETGTITESPDITVLVNAAIVNNAGILKLMVQKVNQSSGSSEINDFHSSRAPGIEEVNKPHLFFNAF